MSLHLKEENNWSLVSRIILKFAFAYFTLFILLLFFAFFLETPLRWFANNILNWGADFKTESTGSGDRSFDFVRLALNVFLSLIVGGFWSFLFKNRIADTKLLYWFQVLIRVFLFAVMILYGLAKVFKGQFADPSLELLLQPVGEMSPMGLAWTFMGHSMAYNIFLGALEIFGGFLLLNRKTVTFGAFVVFGVMLNVAFMNFTYDIPVKLFSTNLVLMSLILLIADKQRILNFFIRNKEVKEKQYVTYIKNKSLLKVISFFKKAVQIIVVILVFAQCFIQFKVTAQLKSKSELYGIWEANLFIKQNDTLPLLLTDDYRWRYLIIDYKGKATVKKMNESIDRYLIKEDEELKEIVFSKNLGSLSNKFSYSFISKDKIKLIGTLNGEQLNIEFKKIPEKSFRLKNRGFHWVNETTFNY